MKYRSKEEAEKARKRDPIELYQRRLTEKGLLNPQQFEEMQEAVAAEVSEAFELADNDPHPAPEERFDDILAERYPLEK
jgi:TPP-dependent pyruvate/acetoin dehydrogenase alpha subunit